MTDKKLEKTARKATASVRAMLERAVRVRDSLDEAIASGRLSGEPLAGAREALTGLRQALASLGGFLARLETAPGPKEQADLFLADPSIGDKTAAAFERCAELVLPSDEERTQQVLVLKGKKGEWAEVEVPLDPEAFEAAVASAEWRGKAGRALAGTRERLEHLKKRGEGPSAKDLEQALDRLDAALRVEEERESLRRQANEQEAALAMRRKWVELGFFERAEAYLAADADALAGLSEQIAALPSSAGSEGTRERVVELFEGWKKRHAGERKALDYALLGSVYDYTVLNEALDSLPDYPKQIQALIQAAADAPPEPPAS